MCAFATRLALAQELARATAQLGNEAFLAKAPANIVDGMRAKLAAYKAQRDKLL